MPFDTQNQLTHVAPSLGLHFIRSVDESLNIVAEPAFDPTISIVSLVEITTKDVGRMIVVQRGTNPKQLGVHVITGFLQETPLEMIPTINKALNLQKESNSTPLVLQSGKSRIELHPNGKIRLVGTDVSLKSKGHMDIRGAWIDLN